MPLDGGSCAAKWAAPRVCTDCGVVCCLLLVALCSHIYWLLPVVYVQSQTQLLAVLPCVLGEGAPLAAVSSFVCQVLVLQAVLSSCPSNSPCTIRGFCWVLGLLFGYFFQGHFLGPFLIDCWRMEELCVTAFHPLICFASSRRKCLQPMLCCILHNCCIDGCCKIGVAAQPASLVLLAMCSTLCLRDAALTLCS